MLTSPMPGRPPAQPGGWRDWCLPLKPRAYAGDGDLWGAWHERASLSYFRNEEPSGGEARAERERRWRNDKAGRDTGKVGQSVTLGVDSGDGVDKITSRECIPRASPYICIRLEKLIRNCTLRGSSPNTAPNKEMQYLPVSTSECLPLPPRCAYLLYMPRDRLRYIVGCMFAVLRSRFRNGLQEP